MGRVCAACEEDMSARHWSAVYCHSCSAKRNATKKANKQRKCLVCEVDISNSHGNTIYCFSCAGRQWSDKPKTPKYASHKIVWYAVMGGILPKPETLNCVDCGRKAEHWEHRDYLKPLDVDPVCTRCNIKRGPGENAELNEQRKLEALQK